MIAEFDHNSLAGISGNVDKMVCIKVQSEYNFAGNVRNIDKLALIEPSEHSLLTILLRNGTL